MEVPICTLAEFAVIRPSKKLDIICATNMILSRTFPAKFSPDTFFAARLQPGPDECDIAYVVSLKVKEPNGVSVFQWGQLLKFDPDEPAATVTLCIGGADVPCPGIYTLSVTLNDEEIASTTFFVKEA